MNLFNIYKKSFSQVMTNPVITLILILFIISSNLFMGFAYGAKSIITTLVVSTCAFLLSLCFIAGWFSVIKDITKDEKSQNKNYFSIFMEGIGKDAFSIGVGCLIYGILLGVILVLTGKIAHHTFGSLDFITKDIVSIAQDNSALMEYLNKLTDEQKYIISAWELSLIFSTMVFNFIMLFYFPSIIYNEKTNMFLKPLVGLKDGIVFLFKNFFCALAIHISIYIVYMLIGIINAALGNNFVISILLVFLNIYFISIAIMLIFNYYEQKNHCDNGCDSIRENENINKSGEEN
ncbi:MAG: hypothetical protein IKL52_00030 [Candidatus Gastranaerophilales bacterium]|nr:hypothetical protein [Candidatus Gastranaerophilales bacterium]